MIFFLKATDRDDAIRQLVYQAVDKGKIESPQPLYKAVIEREKVITTGIGMGVAIPHAKLKSISNFFITIGILEQGVDWKALDGHPVRLIFLIGGPDDRQTEYLKILSSLTLTIKEDSTRKELLNSNEAQEVYQLFEGTHPS